MNSDFINPADKRFRLATLQRLSRWGAAVLALAIALAARTAYSAAADENFDGVAISGGYSFGASPRTINGWTFRLVDGSGSNDGQAYVDVTNQSGDTALANNGSDKALLMGGWFNVAASARISTSDGSEFSLVSFRVDNGAASSGNYRVVGYRDGSTVSGASQNFFAATYANNLVTLTDAAWGNIDEFRIVRQDGSADVSFYIDDIDVSAAVVPNRAPTDVQLSNTTVSQSAGVNAVVGALSTTDPDADPSFTYTLVAGTGDTDNGSFNISESSLRANDAGSLAAGDYSVRVQTDDNNGGSYAEAFTVTVADDVAPTVASVGAPTNGTYRASVFLDFTVTFTEPVTVLGVPALEVTVGETARTATFHSGGGTTDLVFRHTVEVDDEDTDGVAVGALSAAGGTIRDAAANSAVLTLNNVASTAGVLVDGVAPLVSSITRKTPLEQVTDATTVVFEVAFSEDMLNVDAAGFAVTPVNDGTVTASVTGVSGGPRIYDVTVLITGGLGEFRLDVNGQ